MLVQLAIPITMPDAARPRKLCRSFFAILCLSKCWVNDKLALHNVLNFFFDVIVVATLRVATDEFSQKSSNKELGT